MTPQQAYDKTTDLLRAYERGECLGGNPMGHIEEYADQKFKDALPEIEMAIRETLVIENKGSVRFTMEKIKMILKIK